MAKRDFLDSVRVARNLFAHPSVSADSLHVDTESIARTLARAAIWLTPASVKGFRAEDFAELGTQRQQELAEAVRDFERVAGEVGPAEPASDKQIQDGATALMKVLAILEPYLPTREEERETWEALQAVGLPNGVQIGDFELISDSDGDPAVRVTVFVDETVIPGSQLGRLISALSLKFRAALSAAGIKRWPFIRLRTFAEHMAG
jgi:hypothetical protein